MRHEAQRRVADGSFAHAGIAGPVPAEAVTSVSAGKIRDGSRLDENWTAALFRASRKRDADALH